MKKIASVLALFVALLFGLPVARVLLLELLVN